MALSIDNTVVQRKKEMKMHPSSNPSSKISQNDEDQQQLLASINHHEETTHRCCSQSETSNMTQKPFFAFTTKLNTRYLRYDRT